jgi:hypothetical protein
MKKYQGQGPVTPVYLKMRDDTPWPEDKVFYLLTARGLFLCRNHPFFQSAVPAPDWPSELRAQEPFFDPGYPKLSRAQIEAVVGFFAAVGHRFSAEAIVLLAWSTEARRLCLIIPQQEASVGSNRWGDTWPIGVTYEVPASLPPHLTLVGDIHSHVDGSAYTSHIDRDDEAHRPGLHIVVGRIHREPPDFHVQAVVDGQRFDLAPQQIMEDYRERSMTFPRSWMQKLRIQDWGPPRSQKAATSTTGAVAQSLTHEGSTGPGKSPAAPAAAIHESTQRPPAKEADPEAGT